MYRHRGVRHDEYAGNSGHGGHIGHTLVILVHDDDGCHVERGGDFGHDGTHVGGWDCVANQFIYFMQKACFFSDSKASYLANMFVPLACFQHEGHGQ